MKKYANDYNFYDDYPMEIDALSTDIYNATKRFTAELIERLGNEEDGKQLAENIIRDESLGKHVNTLIETVLMEAIYDK